MKSVYSAVRTGSLNKTDIVYSLKDYTYQSISPYRLSQIVVSFRLLKTFKNPYFTFNFYDGYIFYIIFEALTLFAFVILKGNKYFCRAIVVTNMKFLYESSIIHIYNFDITVIYYHCIFTSLAAC